MHEEARLVISRNIYEQDGMINSENIQEEDRVLLPTDMEIKDEGDGVIHSTDTKEEEGVLLPSIIQEAGYSSSGVQGEEEESVLHLPNQNGPEITDGWESGSASQQERWKKKMDEWAALEMEQEREVTTADNQWVEALRDLERKRTRMEDGAEMENINLEVNGSFVIGLRLDLY